MVEATEAFLSGTITLRDTVRVLEDSLDAAELKDRGLLQEFYRHWSPLEEHYAASVELGTPADSEPTRRSVEDLRDFLLRMSNRVRDSE